MGIRPDDPDFIMWNEIGWAEFEVAGMGDQIVRPISWPTLAAYYQANGIEPERAKTRLFREMSAAFTRGWSEAKSKKVSRHPETWKQNRRLLREIDSNGSSN